MKIIVVLLSFLGLLFTVGCEEEEHEHFHRGPHGGAYEGNYEGYRHGYYYPDNGGVGHNDRD